MLINIIKKKSLVIFSCLLIAILLGFFVIAELGTNDAIKIVSPSSGSNFTNLSLGQTFLNVTFLNGTGITGEVAASFNVTFLVNNTFLANGTVNLTGKWMQVANGTGICVRIGDGPRFSCAVNSSNINFTLLEGTYSLTANITNATMGNITNLANSSQTIKIDRSAPRVGTSNFTGTFAQGVNLSSINTAGLFTINISIDDVVLGVQTVRVNITNRSSGVSNRTLTLTREGTTNQFITTINTSHYMDGVYNLTVMANDSLNNLNNSAVLENIIFDSNAPTIDSFSCTPNPAEEDESITCSCSASDPVAGMNLSYGSSGISTTVNPSSAQTGPSFEVGCSVQDNAGNVRSATTTYSVISLGGSGGSSSSSGGGSSSGGSGGGTGLSPESTSGSEGAGSNEGASDTSLGENDLSSSGMGIKVILIIVLAAIVVTAIIVMVRKKK